MILRDGTLPLDERREGGVQVSSLDDAKLSTSTFVMRNFTGVHYPVEIGFGLGLGLLLVLLDGVSHTAHDEDVVGVVVVVVATAAVGLSENDAGCARMITFALLMLLLLLLNLFTCFCCSLRFILIAYARAYSSF